MSLGLRLLPCAALCIVPVLRSDAITGSDHLKVNEAAVDGLDKKIQTHLTRARERLEEVLAGRNISLFKVFCASTLRIGSISTISVPPDEMAAWLSQDYLFQHISVDPTQVHYTNDRYVMLYKASWNMPVATKSMEIFSDELKKAYYCDVRRVAGQPNTFIFVYKTASQSSWSATIRLVPSHFELMALTLLSGNEAIRRAR